MRMQSDSTVIQVFAKAPIAGYAKTRLAPVLGEDGAANLHRQLVVRTMEKLLAGGTWPIELWCAPDCTHDLFVELEIHSRVSLHRQQGKDLGERMCHALRDALDRYDRAILIGTDCPDLHAGEIHEAADALKESDDAVLGPAADGGYTLIGLTNDCPFLFSDIDWGSDRVLHQTRDRLKAAKMHWHELTTHRDLDDPDDLALLSGILNEDLEETET